MSITRMIPVPMTRLDCLRGILARRFDEIKNERELKSDALLDYIKICYEKRSIDCYVNDLDNPTHFLALSVNPQVWDTPAYVFVNSIYIDRDKRGDSGALRIILEMIENYAKFYGIGQIYGSSRLNLETGEELSKLWSKAGFTAVETIYRKTL